MKQRKFDEIIIKETNDREHRLVLFRNIKEFSKLFFERVNPTHIIDIWGMPYKKYRKTQYANYIRVGRILIKVFVPIFSMNLFNFSVIPYFFGFLISFYFINYVMLIIDGIDKLFMEVKYEKNKRETYALG